MAKKIIIVAIILGSLGAWPWLRGRAQSPSGTPVQVPLTMTETDAIARTNDPVTSGIPIDPANTTAAWSLFDGNTEIPLQTKVLPGQKVPWLLLDFQKSLTASQSATLTLKQQAPTVSQTNPVTITEAGNTTTVTTGPAKFVINSSTFNLFDEVWVDANSNGSFGAGEEVVVPTSADNVPLVDSGAGQTLSGRGTPTAFTWEDRGPLRSTLRVDGVYGTALTYTTRITFYANRADVRIVQLLKNSNQLKERYVKVTSAKIILGASTNVGTSTKSGDLLWASLASAGGTFQLIPATAQVTTSISSNGSRVNQSYSVSANNGMMIGDLSYFGGTVVADFTPGVASSDYTRRTLAVKTPLFALAPDSWYSDLGAFGSSHFGTYADEKATYQKWGWVWPNPLNHYADEHNLPRYASYDPNWITIDADNDPENDELWNDDTGYIRTRQQNYRDRMMADARYLKWEWADRSDGFHYAQNDYWEGPHKIDRTPVVQPTLTTIDQQFITNDYKHAKAEGSHLWAGGLVDYYYLTGDRDALDAAIDTGEICDNINDWLVAGSPAGTIGTAVRSKGRCWTIFQRLWEATGTQHWLDAMNHERDLFLQSLNYDQRGFYYTNTCDLGASYCSRYPGGKEVTPFSFATGIDAMYSDWLITNNSAERDRLVAIANFAKTMGLDPVSGITGDEMVIDWPAPGDFHHYSFSEFRNTTPAYPVIAGDSASFIDALVIGYRLTGDKTYLASAKISWGQTSKRIYVDPYDQTIADATHVGRFQQSLQGGGFYQATFIAGDFYYAQYLFYDAARLDDIAPAAVGDLRGA